MNFRFLKVLALLVVFSFAIESRAYGGSYYKTEPLEGPEVCESRRWDVIFYEKTAVSDDNQWGRPIEDGDVELCQKWALADRKDYKRAVAFAVILIQEQKYKQAFKFLTDSIGLITTDSQRLYLQKLAALAALEVFASDSSDENFHVAVNAHETLLEAGDKTGHAGLVGLFGSKGRNKERALSEMLEGIKKSDIGTLIIAERVFLTGRVALNERFEKIIEPNFVKAFDISRQLSKASQLQHNISLASYYRLGIGVEKNIEKAQSLSRSGFEIENLFKDAFLLALINEEVAAPIFESYESHGDDLKFLKELLEGNGLLTPRAEMVFNCLMSEGSFCIHNYAKSGDVYWQGLSALAYFSEFEKNGFKLETKRLQRALEYAKNSAAEGYREGRHALGLFTFLGSGTELNEVEGLRLIKLAASQGFSPALNFLDNVYGGDIDTAGRWKNLAEAIKWSFSFPEGWPDETDFFMTDALSEDREEVVFNIEQRKKMKRLFNVVGGTVTVDWPAAKTLSERGNAEAVAFVFYSYLDRDGPYFSLAKAEEFVANVSSEYAAELYVALADTYSDGVVVEPNFTKVTQLLKKAMLADENDEFYGGTLYARLGYMYKVGQGVRTDFGKAREYLEKSLNFSADNGFGGGDSFALLNLGEIFLKGLGTPADKQKALRYYMDAGDAGNMNAFVILSEIYELGLGVEVDPRKAYFWMNQVTNVSDSDRKQAKMLGRPDPEAVRGYKLANLQRVLAQIPDELRPRGRQIALLIGAKDYDYLQDLKTPIADIDALGKILQQKYSFEVEYLKNPLRADITKKFSEYQKSLEKNDNLLIYYAGHGIEEFGDGYWLPVDASSDDNTNWISNDYITRALKTFKSTNIVLISDSCFSGTLSRGIKLEGSKVTNTLDLFERTKSRIVITSGNLTPVLDGGGGEHSIFARGLLQTLTGEMENFSSTTMFEKLQRTVTSDALSKDVEQTPTIAALTSAGHIGPDFVFYTGWN